MPLGTVTYRVRVWDQNNPENEEIQHITLNVADVLDYTAKFKANLLFRKHQALDLKTDSRGRRLVDTEITDIERHDD